MSQCTAPVEGHRKPGSAAKCPVPSGAKHAPSAGLPRPTAQVVRLPKSSPARRRLADDLSAPPEVLAALVGDEEWHVREGVARNPSTPPGALTALATDGSGSMRATVAGNPSTPPEVLAVLAGDEFWDARRGVAQSPGTPPEVLATLTADGHGVVREEANKRIPSRMSERLGIDETNTDALNLLREERWWEMDANSPAVVVAKALHPNA